MTKITQAEAESMVNHGFATAVCRPHQKPVKYPKKWALGCAQCCEERVAANKKAFEEALAEEKAHKKAGVTRWAVVKHPGTDDEEVVEWRPTQKIAFQVKKRLEEEAKTQVDDPDRADTFDVMAEMNGDYLTTEF